MRKKQRKGDFMAKHSRKSWWQKHWDEVILIGGLSIAALIAFLGKIGVIK